MSIHIRTIFKCYLVQPDIFRPFKFIIIFVFFNVICHLCILRFIVDFFYHGKNGWY